MAKYKHSDRDEFGNTIDPGIPIKRKGNKRHKNNVINMKPAKFTGYTTMIHDENNPKQPPVRPSVIEETVVHTTVVSSVEDSVENQATDQLNSNVHDGESNSSHEEENETPEPDLIQINKTGGKTNSIIRTVGGSNL